ncbi:MAG: glutamate--tRNA ligase [Alphaproteobacteria bacterium]|jgi:glutamyl-tRNA synthetase|nr:glutamate--tRNA ligase [Alphaproteobacteria bacterium]
MKKELVERLISDDLPSIAEIEAKYPKRNLPEGAVVSRTGPSPTGFMHIGTIYQTMISKKLVEQTNGKFFLRIEDTDTKREVSGAREIIVDYLIKYGLLNKEIDEGPFLDDSDKDNYGPYTQSKRANIYKAYIKYMLENDLAYPCFCTTEQLNEVREGQKKEDLRTGYYGNFARCRRLSEEDIIAKLDAGLDYVIRFKSNGKHSNKILIEDSVKGKRNIAENDFDIPILKGDGLPSYHFAHLIDDHLMGTNLVVRGDEWISSLPLHLQLFETMGWEAPKYAHISPIEKMDDGKRRKLSKRKDPEASVVYYDEVGYPVQAVLEYLFNIANSDFEQWRKQNPLADLKDFELKVNKLNKSGALFDFDKLNHVSQNYISRLTKDEVYNELEKWAINRDTHLHKKMVQNKDYIKEIINIERENTNKPRKDITMWSQAWDTMSYFFDDEFSLTKEEFMEKAGNPDPAVAKAIVIDFIADYDKNMALDKSEWFNSFKELAEKHGYCTNGKEYKKNPDAYKGSMANFAKIFRVLLTGEPQSPDLYYMMHVMGKERVFKRISI